MKPPRPFSITLICLLLLGVAVLYLARVFQTLAQWTYLNELLPFSPVYLAISGAIWALISIFLAVYLWLGAGRAPRLTLLILACYTVYYWLEYIFLVDHAGLNPNWPFLVGVNLAVILWVLWVLSRPVTRVYFGEENER